MNNGTMIEWTRRRDGTFAFDYRVFDRYVEFASKCGITDAITCYSMIPWDIVSAIATRHRRRRLGLVEAGIAGIRGVLEALSARLLPPPPRARLVR